LQQRDTASFKGIKHKLPQMAQMYSKAMVTTGNFLVKGNKDSVTNIRMSGQTRISNNRDSIDPSTLKKPLGSKP
jgi:hypothetical protein